MKNSKMKGISDEYLAKAEDYMKNHWQFHNHLHYPRHQKRLKHLASFAIGEVLEIGAASGLSTNYMQSWYPECKFHGIEITEWGYQEALKNYPHIPMDRGCAEDLPYADESFDTVLMPEILEHVEVPEACIKEAWRVCKQRMILTSPVNLRGQKNDPDHKRFFTHEQMKATLIKCGIPIDKVSFHDLNDQGDPAKDIEDAFFGITVVDK